MKCCSETLAVSLPGGEQLGEMHYHQVVSDGQSSATRGQLKLERETVPHVHHTDERSGESSVSRVNVSVGLPS